MREYYYVFVIAGWCVAWGFYCEGERAGLQLRGRYYDMKQKRGALHIYIIYIYA
jgi:hypothetical protein